MANFNRFIDPKTKQPLIYQLEESVLTTEDRKISYPVINGIPSLVSLEFHQEVVDDIANAINNAIRRVALNECQSEIFNVYAGNPISMKDLAHLVILVC